MAEEILKERERKEKRKKSINRWSEGSGDEVVLFSLQLLILSPSSHWNQLIGTNWFLYLYNCGYTVYERLKKWMIVVL